MPTGNSGHYKNTYGAQKETLKPCPFCGGKSEIWESKANNGFLYGYAARCSRCKSRSKIYSIVEQAVEAWNRRVTDEWR